MRKALVLVLGGLVGVLGLVTLIPRGSLHRSAPVQPVALNHVVQQVEAGTAAGKITVLYLWAS